MRALHHSTAELPPSKGANPPKCVGLGQATRVFACGINKVYHVSTLASLFPQCSLGGATVAANLDSGSGPAEHSAVWAGLWPYGRWIHGYMVSTVTEADLERAVFHAKERKKNREKHLLLQNKMNSTVFLKFEACFIWNLLMVIRSKVQFIQCVFHSCFMFSWYS